MVAEGMDRITACSFVTTPGRFCAAALPAQATSAALGYLLLFIDQVGLIMGGPMLHESMYQGSTSSIWQPPGFWTRQPRSPAAVLPLNVLSTGLSGGATVGQAAYPSSTSRWGLACSERYCCENPGGHKRRSGVTGVSLQG